VFYKARSAKQYEQKLLNSLKLFRFNENKKTLNKLYNRDSLQLLRG